MKILEIKYDHTYMPNMSCGTGYTEPSYWNITWENGKISTEMIDIWYSPKESIIERFCSTIKPERCDNYEEAFMMFIDAIVDYGIRYNKEEQKRFFDEFMKKYKNKKDKKSLRKEFLFEG